MSSPRAVLISDVHYSLATLPLAEAAFRMAVDHAAALGVPLIDCGDLTNDKAVLRAEVVNALISTMKYAAERGVEVICLVGNHSLLNEKHSAHALEFLSPYCEVVDSACSVKGFNFIPYTSDPEEFKKSLSRHSSPVIIHQGVKGGNAGHYIQDHSAVDVSVLKGYRTVGGHYHNHHTIQQHTFVGDPYTLTFAEANDPPKGFCVLHDDGSLEHIPTKLRKHIVIERTLDTVTDPIPNYRPDDLIWMKVTGTSLELDHLSRKEIAAKLNIPENFKFDKIQIDQKEARMDQKEVQTDSQLLDALIDVSGEAEASKAALKALYREVMA